MRRALLLVMPLVLGGCEMPSDGTGAYEGPDDGGSPEAAIAAQGELGLRGPSRAPIELGRRTSATLASGDQTSAQSTVLAAASAEVDPFRDAAPSSLHFARAEPGRYAMILRDGYAGGCSRSRTRSDSLAAVSLVLAPSGRATACRARQSQSTTTSMELVPTPRGEGLRRSSGYVRTEREQRGYRGAWSRDGDAIAVVLRRDDGVCAPRAEGYATPPETWRLRCAAVRAHEDGVTLPGAGLACTVAAQPWGENQGYTVRSLDDATALWVLLGPDHGWKIRSEGMRLGGYGSLEVTRASARIDVTRAVDLEQLYATF